MGGTLLLLFNLQTLPQARIVAPGQVEEDLQLSWEPTRTEESTFNWNAPTWEEP